MSAPLKRDRVLATPPAETASGAMLFDAVVALVAREVATRVGAPAGAPSPAFYSTRDNPLGRAAFLDAAKRRCFPSHKVGKTVFAERALVDAWILAHPPPADATARKPRKARGDAPAREGQAELPMPVPDPNLRIDRLLARARIGPGKRD